MAASRIFSRLAELLDVQVTRAAAVWLRLNADGSTSQLTAPQTLEALGAASTSALAGKASLAATNNFTGTQTFAQPVYLSGAVMGTVTTPIAGAYNGPGTGLTGTAQDLIVGQAFTANALTSVLPIISGGTGANNLDALQPKITSLNASEIRTDLKLTDATASLNLAGLTVASGDIAASRPLALTQTWSTTATYTGLRVNITDSGPSNAASLLMDLQVGGVSKFSVNKGGTTTGTIVIASDSFALIGFQFYVRGNTGATIGSNLPFGWSSGTNNANTGSTTQLWRDETHIIAQRNGTNAQKMRIYGTTTGSKYVQLEHDGTNAKLTTTSGNIHISNIPTTNPGPGILWNDAGTLKIGT